MTTNRHIGYYESKSRYSISFIITVNISMDYYCDNCGGISRLRQNVHDSECIEDGGDKECGPTCPLNCLNPSHQTAEKELEKNKFILLGIGLLLAVIIALLY